MRGSGALALLVAARCFVEAVIFAALAAVAHASVAAREPLGIVPTVLVLFGVALLLATILREAGGGRRSGLVVVVTLVAAAAWGLSLPMTDPDGLAILSRVVLFGILGEAFLWRVLSVARGAVRWTDARGAAPIAAAAIAVVAIGPWPADRGPLSLLALLVVAASGLALSLARTSEELAHGNGASGGARASTATSATVVLAIVAIVAAAFVPAAQDAFQRLGTAVGPIVGAVLYAAILPIAYLAGVLVELIRPLVSGRWPELPPSLFRSAQEDEELLRQIEATRPYVFGAVELIVVAFAVLVALLLLERMLRERRLGLPAGVELEREGAAGISLLETLRALRPRGPARRTAPHDDGTPAGALRLIYWRFLALAERRGAGWRGDGETPREHVARIGRADASWRPADAIVAAFEDLRYGERAPEAATIAATRAALRSLEAPPRRA